MTALTGGSGKANAALQWRDDAGAAHLRTIGGRSGSLKIVASGTLEPCLTRILRGTTNTKVSVSDGPIEGSA